MVLAPSQYGISIIAAMPVPMLQLIEYLCSDIHFLMFLNNNTYIVGVMLANLYSEVAEMSLKILYWYINHYFW